MEFNERSAEFIGIMLGDGYISYPKQPRVKISFNSLTDKEYLKFVNGLLIKLFNDKPIIKQRNNENTVELYLFKKQIIQKIINKYKLVPSPKWKKAKIPNWVFKHNLEKYVLRGYFDTDGCLVLANNNNTLYPRLEMKISPSPMQKQFIKILRKFGFNFGVYSIGKGKVRVQMNGRKELSRWNVLIGFNNDKHQKKCELF